MKDVQVVLLTLILCGVESIAMYACEAITSSLVHLEILLLHNLDQEIKLHLCETGSSVLRLSFSLDVCII